MSVPHSFDPARLIPGTPGKLPDVMVAPIARQPSRPGQPLDTVNSFDNVDNVDPVFRAKATEAAVKFESFFIGHMLHQMRSGVRVLADEDSAMNNQVNQDMLDMADNLVADQLAGRRAFGVADAILRQLLPQPAPPADGRLIAGAQNSDVKINSQPLNRSR